MPVGFLQRKGMPSLCFSPKAASSSISRTHPPRRSGLSTPRHGFSSVAERSVAAAELIISKWDPNTSTFAKVTSLFYSNRGEARDFIKCVNELQKFMHFLVNEDPNSEKLKRGQYLMEIAMKRLQKEFYQILSMNRALLDPESVSARSSVTSIRSTSSEYEDEDEEGPEDDIRIEGACIGEVEHQSDLVMADLRSIVECMTSSGYVRECVKIYKIIRKGIVDEGIYRLGVERLSSSQVNKMNWQVLDLKIKNWLDGMKIALKTLFNGERVLCDHVFANFESIRESCFTDIATEGAQILLGFPEFVAKNRNKSPEKIFRLLDMYSAMLEHWPDIELLFSFESTSAVRSQAVTSLNKLGVSIQIMIAEFESALQKDLSKSPVADGGIHPLTVQVVNHLLLLSDYSSILEKILADDPLLTTSSLPEFYLDASAAKDSPAPAMSLRFAWVILVLLCNLDDKAKHYKDVSLSYLFLANNLHHVVTQIRTSNLKQYLSEDWISKHESKVKQFAVNHERRGWDHVVRSLPENPSIAMTPEELIVCFRRFNIAFKQAYQKQSMYIVPENKLLEEIRVSIARKLVPGYRELYNTHGAALRTERNSNHLAGLTPVDLENYLSNLYQGTECTGSFLSSHPTSPRRPLWRRFRLAP